MGNDCQWAKYAGIAAYNVLMYITNLLFNYFKDAGVLYNIMSDLNDNIIIPTLLFW